VKRVAGIAHITDMEFNNRELIHEFLSK
jgi:hypothetical protein